MSHRQYPAIGSRLARRGSAVRAVAAFCLFFLYVWLRIDPRLIYHVQEPVFFRGWPFFAHLAALPGGVTEYLSALLSQSFVLPWLGALVLALTATLICAASRSFLTAVGGGPFHLLSLVPAALLLILHNRYRWGLAFDLGLLLALGLAAAWARLPVGRAGLRLVVFAALSPLLYWVAGGPFLVFASLCALYELAARRHAAMAAASLALGGILPYAATLSLYPGRVRDAYLALVPVAGDYLVGAPRLVVVAAALYLFVPVAALAVWRRKPQPDAAPRAVGDGSPGSLPGCLALNAALLALASFPVYATFDENYRSLLRIDYCASHRQWTQVLEEATQLRAYTVLAVYDVQRALCHLGRMSEEQFAYPHLVNSPIFAPSPDSPPTLLVLGDNLMELGQVNEAEHLVQEALEIYGDRPSILRRLVAINVLKGRDRAARVYLGLLEKSPLHRAWAARYRRALDADPRLSSDEELNRIRAVVIDADYPGFYSPEELLLQLLKRNPTNGLAFDFLMGHYLQTGQLEKAVLSIQRLGDFPERFPLPLLPRLYEEAVLLYLTQARLELGTVPQVPLYGRQVSAQTLQRFAAFSQVLAANESEPLRARQELAPEFGGTYWYYYLYRGTESGVPAVSRATRPR